MATSGIGLPVHKRLQKCQELDEICAPLTRSKNKDVSSHMGAREVQADNSASDSDASFVARNGKGSVSDEDESSSEDTLHSDCSHLDDSKDGGSDVSQSNGLIGSDTDKEESEEEFPSDLINDTEDDHSDKDESHSEDGDGDEEESDSEDGDSDEDESNLSDLLHSLLGDSEDDCSDKDESQSEDGDGDEEQSDSEDGVSEFDESNLSDLLHSLLGDSEDGDSDGSQLNSLIGSDTDKEESEEEFPSDLINSDEDESNSDEDKLDGDECDNNSSSHTNYSPEDVSSKAKKDLNSDNPNEVKNVMPAVRRRGQRHTRMEGVGSTYCSSMDQSSASEEDEDMMEMLRRRRKRRRIN